MPNLGRGRGAVPKRISPNISQRRTQPPVTTPGRSPNPLPSQYNFTPSSQPPVTQMPQRTVTQKPQPPVTLKPQPQPHFRDFPPPIQLFQNSTPQQREIGSSSSSIQNQKSPSAPLQHSPPPPLQHSPASPHHHSQGQSNHSEEALNFDDEALNVDDEEDEIPPLDPVLDDDLQQLLDSLLLVPGREEFTTVLSPTPKPNTLWFLRDKGKLVRKITKVFTNKFDGPYYSWTVVPRRRRQRYLIEFVKTHTWDPLISGTVQMHFETICQRRMKGMVSRVRTSRIRPSWINRTLWTQMTAYWNTDEAKQKSKTYSKARKSDRKGLGPHIHLSGQKSYLQIQQEMEEELQRPVSIGEVFIRTHTKPDGTFVDLKAKKIAETYEENVKAKLSELEAENSGTLNGDPQPRKLSADELNELFLMSTNRDARGRPYGFGSLDNSHVNGKRKHSGCCSSFVALQQELEEAKRQIEEQFAANVRNAAEQQRKNEHFTLVEEFLTATNPEFVEFMASHPTSQPAPSSAGSAPNITPS